MCPLSSSCWIVQTVAVVWLFPCSVFQDGGQSKELSSADTWNVDLLGCEVSVENLKHPALTTVPELINAVYC